MGSQFSAVEFLLRMNAMLEPQCRQGRTPMYYACGSDNVDIVRLLLSAGAQAEIPVTSDLRRPIHIAALTGNVEIVHLLCERGVAIDCRDLAGDRPLCIAAYHGHTEVVEKLLDFKAPLRLPFGDRSYEDSPLCVAAKEGHLGVVSVLLKRGASVRQKDELGWPPIRYAAHYGHPEVLELLLNQASHPSNSDTGTSAFGHIGEYVGFAAGSNISEERKARVRELLFQTEHQANNYTAERTMLSTRSGFPEHCESQAAELDIGFPGRNQATTSYSQEIGAAIANNAPYCGTPTFFPFQSDSEASRYQALSPQPINDTAIHPFMSRPGSNAATRDMSVTSPPPLAIHNTPAASNSAYNQPWSQSASVQMTPMPQLSPEEATQLIKDRRKEIAQLQLFLPYIDKNTVHDFGEYYPPAPVVYEMPS